jgi:hypothetical protein
MTENPKEKKIANKTVDYALRKRKLTNEKLKVKQSRIKHKIIIISEDSRKSKKNLVKSELEYFDYSESKEERFLIKEKIQMMMKEMEKE